MKIENYHLGFVGFGKMAEIIFRAIDAARLIPRSQILFVRRDSLRAKENEQEFKITSTTLGRLVDSSNILVLCAPPNQAEFVLQDLAKEKAQSRMILSVMGGVKISLIQKYLGAQTPVARIAPNIASSIREGVTLVAFSPHPSIEFRSLTDLVVSCLGHVVEIAEQQIDTGVGMVDGGAAFALELIDAMARLGEKEGIAYAKALKMAAQAFSGAAHLVLKGAMPQEILTQVSLPDSPIAKGLENLRMNNVVGHIQSAVRAAAVRSRQISEEFF
jgi:pyrroline-5-carboxylate reductase